MQRKKALENTKEYKDCLESINRDHVINGQLKSKVVVLGVVNRINLKSFFMNILIMLISDYITSRRIDDSLLAALYSDFEKFFYEDSITIVTLSALKGFHSYDANLAPLSGNISIRKLSLEEKY